MYASSQANISDSNEIANGTNAWTHVWRDDGHGTWAAYKATPLGIVDMDAAMFTDGSGDVTRLVFYHAGRRWEREEETMNDEQLSELEALANAATPGPWGEVAESGEWWLSGPDIYDDAVMSTNDTEISQADVDFIAAARTDVPALVAEVRRLRGKLEAATASAEAAEKDANELRAEDLAAQLAAARRENAAMREDIALLCHWIASLEHIITVSEMARLQRVRQEVRARWFKEVQP